MFEPGTKVVCVNDKFPEGIHDVFNALPSKGELYTIRDIVPGIDFGMAETVSVYLCEIHNRPNRHGIEPGFQANRFAEPETTEEVEEYADAITTGDEWKGGGA